MLFYPQEKLALFIDGANLYGAAKGLQSTSTTSGCSNSLRRKGVLVRAFLLYRGGRGSGILTAAAAGGTGSTTTAFRWVHQAAQGIHGRPRGRAASRAIWTSSWPST